MEVSDTSHFESSVVSICGVILTLMFFDLAIIDFIYAFELEGSADRMWVFICTKNHLLVFNIFVLTRKKIKLEL